MFPHRRSMIAGAAAAAFSAGAFAAATVSAETADLANAPGTLPEMAYGLAKEPLYVYLSMGCPSCAHWHAAELPQLRRDQVETGRVRIVYREYPLDPRSFAAAMIARRAGDRYFQAVDLFLSRQDVWKGARDAAPALRDLAAQVGVDGTAFDALMGDKDLYEAIKGIKLHGASLGVRGTPTMFIRGEKVEGDMPASEIGRRYA